ncbi:DUF86 domain-containing protein [bacterium]|nr:DUF86 domain-containing protein [bacterium]MBU1920252.1 DUF86 domain-containing protein [bacterium]
MSDKSIRRDEAWLEDILDAAQGALEFVKHKTVEDFVNDDMLQSGVFWKIGIIGEATRQLSDEYKQSHPDVPWHEMAGMRNRLVHEYKRIDLEQVWDTVRLDIPKLVKLIKPLL